MSFKVDKRTAHAVAGVVGVFEGFDLRMTGKYLMDLLFEFALTEAMYDPDLDLAFHDRIVERSLQRLELELDSVFIVHLAALESCAVDMQVYLLTKHRGIGLAALDRVSSTHHIAAQETGIYLL